MKNSFYKESKAKEKHQNDSAILKIVKLFNVVSLYMMIHINQLNRHMTHIYISCIEDIEGSIKKLNRLLILRKTLRETNLRMI